MGTRFWVLLLMCALAVVPASAQETRGNINGTVQDAQGVIPGANVRIINVATTTTQRLVTNGSGYFEAPLLPAGNYRVTVEMPGFSTLNQNLELAVGQTLSLKLTLTVGQVTEQVDVTAEAPLLDTTSVSSGQSYDKALISGLPLAADQPMLLARFAQGVLAPTTQPLVLNGQIDGPTNAIGDPLGGVGGFNYTIDGATNAGNNRRIAASPTSDVVQEVRVETSNFDAGVGHGLGGSIALSTKSGTNQLHGTSNYQYWTNKINSLSPQQKLAFTGQKATEDLYRGGHSNNGAFTIGGPVVIPKVVDGRGKLFFFGNVQRNFDSTGQRTVQTSTIPANAKHLQGDFSDLLTLPSPDQYKIYDPLTAVPNGNGVLRTAFPNNIIPRDRIFNADGSYKNPLFGLYAAMVPGANQNFIESGSVPQNNYSQAGVPNRTNASSFGIRADYHPSSNDRIFFRAAGTTFHEAQADWTFQSEKYRGLHTNDKTRASWSYTGNYTKVLSGSTVLDTQFSTNRFFEDQQRRGLHKFTPADVGLPQYITDYCKSAQNCMMPRVQINGYQGISNTADGGLNSTNIQIQSTLSSVKNTHTLRGGMDYRLAMRNNNLIGAGDVSSTFSFDTSFTRPNESSNNSVAVSSVGPSLAAFMLGVPTSVSIGRNAALSMRNPYLGLFVQDSWRVNPNFTLSVGLRFEYEDGIKEKSDRWITEFDPTAVNAITAFVQEAYAKTPIPQVPAARFSALGGSVYAGTPGALGKTWNGEAMWMPRVSGSYRLGDKTVVKAGWGLFYDTLNAADYTTGNQLGYTEATTTNNSADFGRTWISGDPTALMRDPFPVRADGTRLNPALADSLGVNMILGTATTVENLNRQHARASRWRFGIQRELIYRLAVEVAYSGVYTDRVGRSIAQSYVPEEYYSSVKGVRDASAQTLLQQNVANPFFRGNFPQLETQNPALWARMSTVGSFFTSSTIQRQNLIRAFPQIGGTGITFSNLPLGVVKQHALEVTVNRRYSAGLSANMAFSMQRVTENRTTETYDRAPNLWQTSQDARPYRISGGGVYELPFGRDKPFLREGGFWSQILGGWQTGGTVEFQPGGLLDWSARDVFFTGDVNTIAKENPEIALRPDGTIDPTKYWFNIAGFETGANAQPANFQKRNFPYRIDNLRGSGLFLVNMNIVRNFALPGRATFQFKVDVQNLFNNILWSNPELNPTSTNFGKITTHPNSVQRFFTFVSRLTF